MKNSVLLIFLGLLGFAIAGCECEDPEPEPCGIATVESNSVPEDSLGYGTWEWMYSIKWQWSFLQEDWVVSDTVYPGDEEAEFNVLQYVRGTIDEGEICFNVSGTAVSGCYLLRNSWLSHASSGPSDTLVACVYLAWDAPGFGGLGLDIYIPEQSDDSIIARMSGLRMFYVADEDAAGVRYRSWFVKVD